MIAEAELRRRAAHWQVDPMVANLDYSLTWFLAAFVATGQVGEKLRFICAKTRGLSPRRRRLAHRAGSGPQVVQIQARPPLGPFPQAGGVEAGQGRLNVVGRRQRVAVLPGIQGLTPFFQGGKRRPRRRQPVTDHRLTVDVSDRFRHASFLYAGMLTTVPQNPDQGKSRPAGRRSRRGQGGGIR